MKFSIDEVIGMAWSDKISFEEINKKTGLMEKEVISIMRKNLKKKSFIIWRKRVRGRISKHRKKTKAELKYYEL
tara:strand:- start:383 stop:604 length:222 start_codon:yes stop_codon:yes gene_type:complete